MIEEEKKWQLVSHYYGHAVRNARFRIEEGKVDEAEDARKKAIIQIEKLGDYEFAKKYIEILKTSNWTNEKGIEDSERRCAEANPHHDDVSDLVKKLFGEQK